MAGNGERDGLKSDGIGQSAAERLTKPKVQRLEHLLVGPSGPKPPPPFTGEDIARSALRNAAARKSDVNLANSREHDDYLGGFGIFHTAAAQTRIAKWDSAA